MQCQIERRPPSSYGLKPQRYCLPRPAVASQPMHSVVPVAAAMPPARGQQERTYRWPVGSMVNWPASVQACGRFVEVLPNHPSAAPDTARTASRLSAMKPRSSASLMRLVMRRVAYVPCARKQASRRLSSSTSSGYRFAAAAPSATLGVTPKRSSTSSSRKMPTRAPYSRWLQVSQSGKKFPNGEMMRGSRLASSGGFTPIVSHQRHGSPRVVGLFKRGAWVSVRNAWCVWSMPGDAALRPVA